MAITPGKFLLIRCYDLTPDDKYSIYIPHKGESAWVMQVAHVLCRPDNMFIVVGPLLFNDAHACTGPFSVSERSYTVLIHADNIMGVYDDTNFS